MKQESSSNDEGIEDWSKLWVNREGGRVEREGRSGRWDEVQQWGLDQQLGMGFTPMSSTPLSGILYVVE